ncbi:MAG: cellulase family glycosylhydrolase [Pirellulales bacterium]
MKRVTPTRRQFLAQVGLASVAAATSKRLPAAQSAIPSAPAEATFVRVSPRDPRYFELSDGRPYIPIGFNLVSAPPPDEMERVVATMADHGVNYCRVWLDQPPWNVEHAKSGQYDTEKARSLDRFLALCRPRGIRVKMCIEYFRSILAEAPRPPVNGLNPKPLHHVANGGFYRDMTDFLTSRRGRDQFKGKLKWYADRYGDEPAVFAWELWNEMNAVRGPWQPWTEEMLPELHRLFPRNLCVQSLGSFDTDRAREQYRLLCGLPANDVLQVHRYLDQGAPLTVCHGPIDLLASDAVGELRAMRVRKPIILTETGAVKPRHTGASELYAKDRDGTLLHDMLFAPFFSGAAGSGHVWFWREAIDRPKAWHHFQRFQRAVEGLDPPAEGFEPLRADLPDVRIYALRGRRTLVAWCRDAQNDWRSELDGGAAPREVKGVEVDLAAMQFGAAGQVSASAYDPWSDRQTPLALRGTKIELPALRRSVVVRVTRNN